MYKYIYSIYQINSIIYIFLNETRREKGKERERKGRERKERWYFQALTSPAQVNVATGEGRKGGGGWPCTGSVARWGGRGCGPPQPPIKWWGKVAEIRYFCNDNTTITTTTTATLINILIIMIIIIIVMKQINK